ncbi:hypothetical protein JK359_24665 [Streptomyces actinomycinicus]|uniref:Gliding motility protein n=1 Tax=Streptomyces actinomycinicus TaxID=1695166 RepID=A0A937JS18_9ACTN|nr:hypothetical protein [Streptomyces actinomycinicus]MBL1085123.1 hypothetical protein [Streptomyces actinomycinicus]
MGVFARLLGRSKTTPEVSDVAAQTGEEPGGAEAERTEKPEKSKKPAESVASAESVESAEAKGAEAEAAEAAEALGTDGDGHAEVAARPDAGTDDASEGAGIPRQQSAEEVADSEAGEGARR